jgi:hypothetical protein
MSTRWRSRAAAWARRAASTALVVAVTAAAWAGYHATDARMVLDALWSLCSGAR